MLRALAILIVLVVPATAAADAHPSITAFKKFIKAVKAKDEAGIKKFFVAEELQVLDKAGVREDLLGELAEEIDPKVMTYQFKGDKNKGIIMIEPAEIPFPVRREADRWVFDVQTFTQQMGENARTGKAGAELRMIQAGLELYRLDVGQYPTEEQGLMALVEKPKKDPIPKTWVQSMDVLPNDPWGKPYQYSLVDGRPVLRSFGRDGVKSDDDIVLGE